MKRVARCVGVPGGCATAGNASKNAVATTARTVRTPRERTKRPSPHRDGADATNGEASNMVRRSVRDPSGIASARQSSIAKRIGRSSLSSSSSPQCFCVMTKPTARKKPKPKTNHVGNEKLGALFNKQKKSKKKNTNKKPGRETETTANTAHSVGFGCFTRGVPCKRRTSPTLFFKKLGSVSRVVRAPPSSRRRKAWRQSLLTREYPTDRQSQLSLVTCSHKIPTAGKSTHNQRDRFTATERRWKGKSIRC